MKHSKFVCLCATTLCLGFFSCGQSDAGIEKIEIKVRKYNDGRSKALDSSKYIETMNEKAKDLKKDLGYEFSFVLSEEKDCDLWIDVPFEGGDIEAYKPLPSSLGEDIENANYLKPIKEYFASNGLSDRTIPMGFEFRGLMYDKTIYKPSELRTFDDVTEAAKNHQGHYYLDNTIPLGYLFDNEFLSLKDCGKKDEQGNLLWCDEKLEPFYEGLNESLSSHNQIIPSRNSPDFSKGDIASRCFCLQDNDKYGFSLLPNLEVNGKETKSGSMGFLYGIAFDKGCKLGENAISALGKFLIDKDDKVSYWNNYSFPLTNKGFEKIPSMDFTPSEIEERVFLFSRHTEKPFFAASEFSASFLNKQNEGFSFTDYYRTTYDRIVNNVY